MGWRWSENEDKIWYNKEDAIEIVTPPNAANSRAQKWSSQKEGKETRTLAHKHLLEPLIDFDKIGSAWAVELEKMMSQQQMFAKKAIDDILFEGQMGTLRRDSVQINSFSCTSTPYTAMHPSPGYYDSPLALPQPTKHIEHSSSSQPNAFQYFSNSQEIVNYCYI
ncbi:hypothetical protein FQA39_LY06063 [Lamprigera yunnana]|nr:hypothetical protein FQA39_LY06063 [Lamprigera yunnana]